MKDRTGAGETMGARMRSSPGMQGRVGMAGRWALVCWASTQRREQDLKWKAPIDNEVTNEGRNELLNATFPVPGGSVASTAYAIGLVTGATSSTVFQRTDAWGSTTMAWTESTRYTEASLVAFTPQDAGSTGAGALSNSTSVASFSVNANGSTFGGAFLASTNTKGVVGTSNASTGALLYAAGRFNVGNKQADQGDTLDVTATMSTTG